MAIPLRYADPLRATAGARTFFVTSSICEKRNLLQSDHSAGLFVRVLYDYRALGKFRLHEFVVMPDHVHALLTPAAALSLERAVQFIKGGLSYRLRKAEKIQVWQESFTNHRIRDVGDYARHCEYVRMNPVRARMVRDAAAYPFSSASPGFRLDAMPPGLKPGRFRANNAGLKACSSTQRILNGIYETRSNYFCWL